ncbi:MAG: rhodanese-related sulfurtransferase, partial [Frankiales bacterium]|nr:rhodanese-related sulfurtransferase [Frankiales bacterium]
GAVHLPNDRSSSGPAGLLDPAVPASYCWGPRCNGSTRSALALSRLGYQVRELIGGFVYWVREGLPIVTAAGARRGDVDPLTGPSASARCDC